MSSEAVPSPDFDAVAAAAVIRRALQTPGGADLVVGSLSGIPYAIATRERSGLLRSEPAQVQIAEWRYCAIPPGRLREAHVVDGIVMSVENLSIAEAGWRVVRALRRHLAEYGPAILPDVLATLEGIGVACG